MPGALIRVKNLDTGIEHAVVSDESGRYRISGLAPGNYEIVIELQGFKREVRSGIRLAVAQQAVIDVVLEVGELAEQVTVVGEAPLIERATSQITGLVDERKMRDLPLNGRDFFQLTTLQPGVVQTPSAGPNPWSKGGITKAAVYGLRPTWHNVMIDGSDVNDAGFNVPPGGTAGFLLGVDSVREFRIFTNTFSAEYGRNAGSIVQAVTRSGTNEFHGSFFEFHRNSVLDAKNFFDRPDAPIPLFIRNQFGGSFGGPISMPGVYNGRDRSFFFLSYEGFRERLGVTSNTTVPNALSRRGILPDPRNPGRFIEVGVDPKIKPFLDLFPLPNGEDFGDGTGRLLTSDIQDTDENYFLIRIDHKLSDNDSLFARYIFDDSFGNVPFLSTLVPGFPGRRDIRNQYFTFQEQKIIRPNLINEFRFAFNRTMILAKGSRGVAGDLSISLVPDRPLGAITIGGLPLLGNNLIFPLGSASNAFQWVDNVSWNKGRHALKFGAEFRRVQINGAFDLGVDGQYLFFNLRDFLQAKPFFFLGTLPGFSDSSRGFRELHFWWFVQDDIQVTPNFTLNLGLRYRYDNNPTEANGRVANIRNIFTDRDTTVGKIFDDVPLDLFEPRLGFAWSPFADKKTVVRGGFGIFRDQIWANLYFDTRFLPPFYKLILSLFPPFLDPLAGPLILPVSSFGITFDPNFPYVLQYNLNIQREITPDMVFKVGYFGSRGISLVRAAEANPVKPEIVNGRPFFPAGGQRVNPNFGSLPTIFTDANSFYNGLSLEFQRRFSRGLEFQVSYTLGKSIDDASGPFPSDSVAEAGLSQDFFNRKGSRGRSFFDVRHNLVINYTYDLPFGPGKKFARDLTGFAAKLAEGWQISGITQFASNSPFTALLGFDNARMLPSFISDRPNLRPGADPDKALLKDTERWFDPSIFELPPEGFLGNAGRNILKGPDFKNFDFSIVKNTKINEDKTVQFRAEFFNIFNHPNFSVPVNTQGPNGIGGNGVAIFADRSGVPLGNAGKIFSTVNTSRQVQFAIKLLF